MEDKSSKIIGKNKSATYNDRISEKGYNIVSHNDRIFEKEPLIKESHNNEIPPKEKPKKEE